MDSYHKHPMRSLILDKWSSKKGVEPATVNPGPLADSKSHISPRQKQRGARRERTGGDRNYLTTKTHCHSVGV